jgi:hypothetical protein
MYSRLKPDVVALNPLYSKWGTFCSTANFNNITIEPNIFVQNTIHNSFDKGCEVAACCCRLQPQKAKSFLSAPTVDGHTRQAVRLQDDFRARTRALEEQHQISHFEWKQDSSLFSLFLKASKEVLFLPFAPLPQWAYLGYHVDKLFLQFFFFFKYFFHFHFFGQIQFK